MILYRINIPFVRLDGTLNQQQREKVIKQFSEDDNIMVSTVLILANEMIVIIDSFSFWNLIYC